MHKYELEIDGLKILDFQSENIFCQRVFKLLYSSMVYGNSGIIPKRYRMLSKKFIEKYGIETKEYDVIKGWRANASYFYIAKAFVRDEIDVEILEELLLLGDLGIQYCIKSELAYSQLYEVGEELSTVEFEAFNEKYNKRDITARRKMKELIDSDRNKVMNVFSTLM